jgi:Tfp pilus assembly protein PilW
VIALTLKEPLIALAIVLVLLAIGISLVIYMRKRIRAALARRREGKRGRQPEGRVPSAPP